MNVRPVGLETFFDLIKTRQAFAFSRWGDGEWSAILGHGHYNCDGQEYTPELRRRLAEVLLQRPWYMLGMQSLATRRFGPEIEAWLHEHDLELAWVDAGVFHTASARGQFQPIIDALAERRRYTLDANGNRIDGWLAETIFVGPERLGQGLGFPIHYHVIVPDPGAFAEIDEAIEALAEELARIETQRHPPWRAPVVAVSAGMGAKILIHEIASRFPWATLIDFGSVWEPYINHSNRSYHQAVIDRLQQGVVT